jgi:tyrosyl-tRNA synthetase
MNTSDEDAESLIKIFTLKSFEEIESIIIEHKESPHLRVLQHSLAEDITIRTHGEDALATAIAATKILFGKSTSDDLKSLSEKDFFAVFDGVPKATVSRTEIESGLGIIDALSAKTGFLVSNGEARRELKGNSISVNKEKVNDQFLITTHTLINDKYVLIGKGKKNNYILIIK